ncbi:cardiolipin synthase [uncultured Algibacter sp.]|uniref:cardiolipin synthase n=1 Tax=uncultured Algibacter sp. TaxID=298659 RepID=UPI0026214AAB|nr:cardiolipin synthase [uncultured Algibacter sp.]
MIDFIKQEFWIILLFVNYLLATSAAFTILLKNINPTKTVSYIIVLIFFPFLGILVYYLFGQEYRKNKIFNRKNILNQNIIKSIQSDLELNKREVKQVDNYLDGKVKLIKLLYNSENSPLTICNDIDVFKEGKTKFARLIQDIESAKHHVHLEYYIIKDDTIGTQLLNAICRKAKEGIEVCVTYDDVGSKISSTMKKKLDDCGVHHYPFMPIVFTKFTGKMNYRNHRKIAVIDGVIGYVGGINIGDEYINNESTQHFWRDTHIRIIGEAVKSLQIYFFTTWDFVSNKKFKINKAYFPETPCKNSVGLQIAASGPDTDWANIMEAIFTAITTADDYVYITTPYFVPNEEITTALCVAAKSGVDIRLIIPKNSDSKIVKNATNSYLEILLQAGVKVYKYKKGFIHAKTMVVDDIFSTVGTSNMDNRSFNINFEVNAFIYDKANSKKLKQHFLEDLDECDRVKIEEYINRPKYKKLIESLSRLWSPLI